MAAALKQKMAEEGVERGEPMKVSTPGKPMTVTAGVPSSRGKRPKELGVFSADDAMELKRKRGFSHDDINEVP